MIPLGYYLYGSEPLQEWKKDECLLFKGEWLQCGSFDMDDYVYDKHTKNAQNRSTYYFATETSKVIPEVFILPPEFKQIYIWSRTGKKKLKEKVDDVKDEIDVKEEIDTITKETDLDFVVRVQLTTSNNKQDVYYASYNDKLYFVKGPYKDRKVIDTYINFQELKKERGIPYIKDNICIMLFPDRWEPKEIPLGYRTKIDQNKKYPFLISPSLISLDQLKTREHQSEKWPKTIIADDKSTEGMRIKDVFLLKDQLLIDYLDAIAFRLEYSIGDFADRNFMIINNRLISVDEEIVEKVNLIDQLKQKKYEFLKNMYKKYREQLNPKSILILDQEFL